MQHLYKQNLWSLILTSGTLSPLEPLIAELQIPNAIQLVNPHVIERFQMCVKRVPFGSDDSKLEITYKNRQIKLKSGIRPNKKLFKSLGNSICEFCKVIPGGVLIFFPSYGVMDMCIQVWKELAIWSSLGLKKRIFLETRSKYSNKNANDLQPKEDLRTEIKNYYKTINGLNLRLEQFSWVF